MEGLRGGQEAMRKIYDESQLMKIMQSTLENMPQIILQVYVIIIIVNRGDGKKTDQVAKFNPTIFVLYTT